MYKGDTMESTRYEIGELINGYVVVIQRSMQDYQRVFMERKLEALQLLKAEIENQIEKEMRVIHGLPS